MSSKIGFVNISPGEMVIRHRGRNDASAAPGMTKADVAPEQALSPPGFDLESAPERESGVLEPGCPYRWMGVFPLDRGAYDLVVWEGPSPTMDVVMLPLSYYGEGPGEEPLNRGMMDAARLFLDEKQRLWYGEQLHIGKRLYELTLGPRETRFRLRVQDPGDYVLFTQHHAREFRTQIRWPLGEITPRLIRSCREGVGPGRDQHPSSGQWFN